MAAPKRPTKAEVARRIGPLFAAAMARQANGKAA